MRIVIETIPHDQQRYDTVGDWHRGADGTVHIKVSELPTKNALFPEKFAFLVALHELVEWALCESAGITTSKVDTFDWDWVPHDGIEEPGDDADAPYFEQHQMASGIERTVAAALGVNWVEYEAAINALSGEDDGKED